MTKERPILFNGAMVRAILSGTKTQTRRAIKGIPWRPGCNPGFSQARAFSNAGEFRIAGSQEMTTGFRCRFGQRGDRLWVRETWMDLKGTGVEHWDPATGRPTRYAYGAESPPGSASDEARKEFGLKWRPSIHMPRAACRLLLEVTEVRVERVQAISEADAWAEGCPPKIMDSIRWFRDMWCATGGDWNSNPWVWAITFKRIEA